MKIIFNVVTAIIFCTNLYSQKLTNSIDLVISPFGFRLNNNIWEETGEGEYAIKKNFTNLSSISAVYSWKLNRNFEIDLGIGLRQIKYNFDYIIHDPFDKENILDKVNRYNNRINISPHIGISYTLKKFQIAIGYEPNIELFSKTNIGYYFGPLKFFFDLNTQESAYFTIVERDAFTDDFFQLATPTVSINYRLSPKFSIDLTSLIKPDNNEYLYQLDIQGKTVEMTGGNQQLNDTKLKTNYIVLYFGVAYIIKG